MTTVRAEVSLHAAQRTARELLGDLEIRRQHAPVDRPEDAWSRFAVYQLATAIDRLGDAVAAAAGVAPLPHVVSVIDARRLLTGELEPVRPTDPKEPRP